MGKQLDSLKRNHGRFSFCSNKRLCGQKSESEFTKLISVMLCPQYLQTLVLTHWNQLYCKQIQICNMQVASV